MIKKYLLAMALACALSTSAASAHSLSYYEAYSPAPEAAAETSIEAAFAAADQSSDVQMRFDGATLTVKSTGAISEVSIYTVSGQLKKRIEPRTQTVTLSLASCPSGIYLVKVVVGDSQVVRKIVKR